MGTVVDVLSVLFVSVSFALWEAELWRLPSYCTNFGVVFVKVSHGVLYLLLLQFTAHIGPAFTLLRRDFVCSRSWLFESLCMLHINPLSQRTTMLIRFIEISRGVVRERREFILFYRFLWRLLLCVFFGRVEESA